MLAVTILYLTWNRQWFRVLIKGKDINIPFYYEVDCARITEDTEELCRFIRNENEFVYFIYVKIKRRNKLTRRGYVSE